MFLLRLYRFLTGYVIFCAEGGFPERFVNLCAATRIPVWDIRPEGDRLVGRTTPGAYLRLRTAAKRSGMRLRTDRKRGVPFFLRRHRKRWGLAVGCVVFVALLSLLSSRVWVIRCSGMETLTTGMLREALRAEGVYEGMDPDGFNASVTERRMLRRVPKLAWIALNVDGSVLYVQVREILQTDEAVDYAHPCHIVASRDGFLTRLETYEGQQIALLRSAVQKGALLISGTVEQQDGSVTLHHAKGYAEAQTTREIVCTTEKKQTYPYVRAKTSRACLHLFSLYIPLGLPPTGEGMYYTYESALTAGGMRLPVSVIVSRATRFADGKTLSAKQRTMLLLSDLCAETAKELRGCRILGADVQTTDTVCRATFRVLENIGVPQEILMG